MSNKYTRDQIYYEYLAKKSQLKSKDSSKELVYPNQAEAAQEVFKAFMVENKVAVTLIALPQAGKTGSFLEVAYQMCTFNDDALAIEPNQLLILTGMSDREWQDQTSGDMLQAFEKRVYHRARFDSVPTILQTLQNSLIIIDECHIAAEKTQSMSAMLSDAGLLDINELRRRRIFLLEVSATPGATLYDVMHWGEQNHSIVILKESPKYIGFRDFIAEGRLHESFNLTKEEECLQLVQFIEQTFPEPRYHIIRLNGKAIETAYKHLDKLTKERKWSLLHHNSNQRLWGLDHIMTTPPSYHSIIIIKEFWRAGKRLCDKYVGIVHEPKTKVEDTNVTSQGLVGRLCGNDKQKGAGAPHAFCNTVLIHEYLEWIKAKGDYTAVKMYRSKNLKAKKGRVTSTDSFLHPSNIGNLEEVSPLVTHGIPVMVHIQDKALLHTLGTFGNLTASDRIEIMKLLREGIQTGKLYFDDPNKKTDKVHPFNFTNYTIDTKRYLKQGGNAQNYRFPQFYENYKAKKVYGQSVETPGKFTLDLSFIPIVLENNEELPEGTGFISYYSKKI